MKIRQSSDSLFHYTKELNTIKLILQFGFRHSLISEQRPSSPIMDKKFMQQNFLVCFCDILPEDSHYHQKCYGDLALVLSKTWGMKNKFSPVRYIHSNSNGIEQEHIELRDVTKGLFKNEHNYVNDAAFNEKIIKNIISWAFWVDNKNINIEMKEREFDDLVNILSPKKKDNTLKNIILKLRQRIADLHQSLEVSDPFLRNYKEDFKCPDSGVIIQDKILYDEREWRSCNISHTFDDIEVTEWMNKDKSLMEKAFLKENCNLKFGDADLVEIKLKNLELKNELFQFLKEDNTNLDIEMTMDKVKVNN